LYAAAERDATDTSSRGLELDGAHFARFAGARQHAHAGGDFQPQEGNMHYVLLAEHTAEVCPSSNATTRDLLMQIAPQIPDIAQRNAVTIVAGPFVNREHVVVAVVEAATSEAVDRFLVESRLPQWNRMRILPSLTMQEGMTDIQANPTIF
jgi:hypothetical protein